MSLERKKLGEIGESVAENYLRKSGYEILERNFKTKYAEIDIVTKKDNVLVFVEVRSKTNDNFVTPEETINKEKKWRLKQNAIGYVNSKKYKGTYRVDAVCIVFKQPQNEKTIKLKHYKNII